MAADAVAPKGAVVGPEGASGDATRELPRLQAGWRAVAAKELADHVLSIRFIVLVLLLGLVAAGAVYAAASSIRDVATDASGASHLFLRLFTVAPEQLPWPFFQLVMFLAPVLGIAFGFDAVNGERSQGTLPRLLAQPIHRDDVINGKFVAGLTVIAIMLTSLTVIVAGVGLLRLGIVPTLDEIARIVTWLILTIVYVAFWLGFAALCSVWMRHAATSALVAIATWLVLFFFGALLVGLLADVIAPADAAATFDEQVRNAQLELNLARLSPVTLYEEGTIVLLNPEIRSLGLVFESQLDRAIVSELALDQSLLLAWPQTVGLVAATVICFAGAYVLFMRQEVRA